MPRRGKDVIHTPLTSLLRHTHGLGTTSRTGPGHLTTHPPQRHEAQCSSDLENVNGMYARGGVLRPCISFALGTPELSVAGDLPQCPLSTGKLSSTRFSETGRSWSDVPRRGKGRPPHTSHVTPPSHSRTRHGIQDWSRTPHDPPPSTPCGTVLV